MKHYILPLALGALLIGTGCDRRDLSYESDPTLRFMHLSVDWSRFGEAPENMTLYCYPKEGGAPIEFNTRSVNGFDLVLPEGEYKFLLINSTPDDFTTIDFRGMDSFETAEATAREKISTYITRADEKITYAPEALGVARSLDVEVADAGDTLSLVPENVLYVGHVEVHVTGINNVKEVYSKLSQLSGGYYLGLDERSTEKVSQELEDWTISYDEGSTREGVIYTTFTCFGLPPDDLGGGSAGGSGTGSGSGTDGNGSGSGNGSTLPADTTGVTNNGIVNSFYIEFHLVDNKTISSYNLDVTNLIELSETTLEFDIDIDEDTSDDGERKPPIEIEDVTPASTDSVGVGDVTIKDWGNEDEIDVQM